MAVSVLKPQFSAAMVEKLLARKVEALHKAVLSRLQLVGETFVLNARESGDYTDRTGNLRSSIGYIILKDGSVVTENIEGKTADGMAQAKKVITELSAQVHSGYALLVVAGMHYAALVEARGFDVLTASGIKAEKDLKKAMEVLSGK